jgi:dienelactone hydrolase
MLRPVVAFVALLLSFTTTALAQSVKFPSVAVPDLPAGPTLTGWIYRPAGAGPFPAVILGHTCGGVDALTDEWGKRLASWGYLTLAPDSFGPRGLKSVCTNGSALTPNARVADVAGALDFLSVQPDVIKGRIAVIGQSHGGKLALRAVQKKFDLASRGLRGGVAYYSNCVVEQDRFIVLPLLLLEGEKDDWSSMANCHALQSAVPSPPLQAIFYPSAMHGFDNTGAMSTRAVPCSNGRTCHLGYDSQAASDAEARTRAFLDGLLRR